MTNNLPEIGYHCSHEQYDPRKLLELAQLAADAGFRHAMCSDHFAPWTSRQGHSGSTWPWLGAALQSTGLTFGTVTAPGYRYHPAVVAQSAATLAQMYPERLWLALGSGEWLNEHIAAKNWPEKEQRNERLRRCAEAIRKLWAGEVVTDESIGVFDARLYGPAERTPLLVGAALTPATAEWHGGWADALVTTAQDRETMKKIVDAFRRGGGEGKPLFLQAVVSYARTDEEALDAAYEQWRAPLLDTDVLATLSSPREFERAESDISRQTVKEKLRISCDLDRHREWLQKDLEIGFSRVFLHNVNRSNQREFIETFGRELARN